MSNKKCLEFNAETMTAKDLMAAANSLQIIMRAYGANPNNLEVIARVVGSEFDEWETYDQKKERESQQ